MTTPSTTEKIIAEHIPYEIDMLRSTYRRLHDEGLEWDIRNALIESFFLHVRTLHDFLSGSTRYQDDVDVRTFTGGGYAPVTVAGFDKDKMNKQIAHLTYLRTSESSEKLNALAAQYIRRLESAIANFERHLKPEFRPIYQRNTHPVAVVSNSISVSTTATTFVASSINAIQDAQTTTATSTSLQGVTGPASPRSNQP